MMCERRKHGSLFLVMLLFTLGECVVFSPAGDTPAVMPPSRHLTWRRCAECVDIRGTCSMVWRAGYAQESILTSSGDSTCIIWDVEMGVTSVSLEVPLSGWFEEFPPPLFSHVRALRASLL